MNAKEPVIIEGVRTPIGVFGGSLKDIEAVELGGLVVKEVLKRAGVSPAVTGEMKERRPRVMRDVERSEVEAKYMNWEENSRPVVIDEVIMGNVILGGQGMNPARQAAIRAGMPQEVTAFTVNKVCASGMKAIALACQADLPCPGKRLVGRIVRFRVEVGQSDL